MLRALRCLAFLVLAATAPLAVPAQSLPASEDTAPGQFIIDSESSWLRVLVFRGGLLRGLGLGHNHVVSHHEIMGFRPLKAGLGTVRVRDTLLLKYEISGTRSTASE